MTKLLTTLRYTPKGSIKDSIYLYDMHVQRLIDGIDALSSSNSVDFKEEALINEVTRAINATEGTETPHRVSVQLDLVDLSINAAATRLTNMPDYAVNVVIDSEPTETNSQLLRYKTTDRDIYNDSKSRNNITYSTTHDGLFDVLMHNNQGFMTETTIANIFYKFQNDDNWYTPPASDGLLPGLMRQSLLDSGYCKERSLRLSELKQALKDENVILKASNALRGLFDIMIV
ncbi:D-aminoacid aminotransferase-like PLP-dependent enzyme [Wallemia mellicola]|nr:D-aminoacid aminotransferase-like PLP-dependent enzyme [Wallemia mellicola]